MKRFCYILMGAVLICAGAVVCHGRVFVRWGSASNSTRAMVSANGTVAYETSVTMNGGKGDLAVIGFSKNIAGVIKELAHIFNTSNVVYSGGTMGVITAKTDGFVLRMTALQLGDRTQTLVFKLQQSETEFQASARPPEQHLMKDIPAFPGSEPVFFAKDDKSNAAVAVSRTSSDTAAVHNFFASQLSSAGWAPALPSADKGTDLQVYSKGAQTFCVLVDASETNGRNRITLLHKQQGIE